jgi:cell pole-organizing protein PopZ
MEEILSSIRRIIADEANDEGQDAAASLPDGEADSPAFAADEDDDVLELTEVVHEEGEVIELDRAMAQPHSLEGHRRLEAVADEPSDDEAEPGAWDQAEADEPADGPLAAEDLAPQHADDSAPSPIDIRDDDMEDHQSATQTNSGLDSLISDRTAGVATGAFAKLSQAVQRTPPELAIADDSGRTVEQFAEDMLRPMLREWLDENLAPLVERIVQREIQKIVRRAEEG